MSVCELYKPACDGHREMKKKRVGIELWVAASICDMYSVRFCLVPDVWNLVWFHLSLPIVSSRNATLLVVSGGTRPVDASFVSDSLLPCEQYEVCVCVDFFFFLKRMCVWISGVMRKASCLKYMRT